MKKTVSPRNKRVSNPRQRKQQHLLEVTVRRDIARQQNARKVVRTLFRVIVLSALLSGTFVGGKEALRRFLWENPDYALTDIRISPPENALTREQILGVTGVVAGRNIFTIDLARAREALDKLPQVEMAEIQRILPNRIDINIVERKPIAWATAKADDDPLDVEKSLLIDARGVVMRSKTVLREYRLLPIISGVEVENLAPGQTVRSFEMQAALDLVRLNADSTRFQIRNIDISKGYCLVVTDRTRSKITFGLDGIDRQLARFHRLLDHTQSMQREIQTVNLLVERNVPVTFVEPAPAETEPPFVAVPPRIEAVKPSTVHEKDKATPPSRPIVVAPREKPAATGAKTTPARATPSARDSRRSPGRVKKPFNP